MLVRAKEKGYYNNILREPGQIFKLRPIDGLVMEKIKTKDGKWIETGKKIQKHWTPEEQFSETWMEKIDPKEKANLPPPPRRGKVGARPAAPDPSEVQKRIANAEKLMANAEADQAEADAEAAEIEAAQGDSEDDGDVI